SGATPRCPPLREHRVPLISGEERFPAGEDASPHHVSVALDDPRAVVLDLESDGNVAGLLDADAADHVGGRVGLRHVLERGLEYGVSRHRDTWRFPLSGRSPLPPTPACRTGWSWLPAALAKPGLSCVCLVTACVTDHG